MNLADTTGNTLSGVRLSAVFADPAIIADSRWARVRIECRENSSDLSRVRFSRCRFTNCYLGNAKLCLEGALFEDCEFKDVTIMHGRLRGAIFKRSRLVDCLLRSADLRNSRFEDCVIQATDFAKADFSAAVFEATELLGMDHWGWQPFEGAKLDDAQRFKHFIATDLGEALSRVSIPRERMTRFAEALARSGFGTGEAMFIYEEWRESISFEDFATLGRAVRQKAGEQVGAGQPATRPESDSEGGDKPQSEAEGRTR